LYSTSPASVPEKDINEQGSVLAGLPGKKKEKEKGSELTIGLQMLRSLL
jgi:hypothetical protein